MDRRWTQLPSGVWVPVSMGGPSESHDTEEPDNIEDLIREFEEEEEEEDNGEFDFPFEELDRIRAVMHGHREEKVYSGAGGGPMPKSVPNSNDLSSYRDYSSKPDHDIMESMPKSIPIRVPKPIPKIEKKPVVKIEKKPAGVWAVNARHLIQTTIRNNTMDPARKGAQFLGLMESLLHKIQESSALSQEYEQAIENHSAYGESQEIAYRDMQMLEKLKYYDFLENLYQVPILRKGMNIVFYRMDLIDNPDTEDDIFAETIIKIFNV